MKGFTRGMWQGAKPVRVAAVAVAIVIAGALLFQFLMSLGDSDLPPYNPPFPGEHATWILWGVIFWPMVLSSLLMLQDPSLLASLPLMLLSGLFWATLIEAGITWRRTTSETEGI
jgi:hypothetical protein